MSAGMKKPKVFISYSHHNEDWLNLLRDQLTVLVKEGLIDEWDDQKIGTGDDWYEEIKNALDNATIAVCLISEKFLGSDFILNKEVPPLLEKRKKEGLFFVPVVVDHCVWEAESWLSGIQLYHGGKVLANLRTNNLKKQEMTKVAKIIFDHCKKAVVHDEKILHKNAELISNLPPRNNDFTGREEYLDKLHKHLTTGSAMALTALAGLGGVGKTELAKEYAHRHKDEYKIVWWIRSEERSSLSSDYAELGRRLGLDMDSIRESDKQIACVKEELEQRKDWLLLFDNAPNKEAMKNLVPQGGRVILTSRSQDWYGLANEYDIDVFPPDQAVKFLLSDRPNDSEEDAQALAEDLGRLPLALAQARAYIHINHYTISQYRKLLEKNMAALLGWKDDGQDYSKSVATTWVMSFEALEKESPAAARMLEIVAFLVPDDIPLDIFRRSPDKLPEPLSEKAADELEFNEVLKALLKYSFVKRDHDAVSIHRLVQTVTRDRMNAEIQKKRIVTAAEILDAAFPEDMQTNVKEWPWAARLVPHTQTARVHSEQADLSFEALWRMIYSTGNYHLVKAEFSNALERFQQALELSEKLFGTDHQNTAVSCNQMGYVYKQLGNNQNAIEYYERALAIIEKVHGKEHPYVAYCLNNIGMAWNDLVEKKKAIEYYEGALTIWEKALGPEHPNVAVCLNNIGGAWSGLGENKKAIEYYEHALAIVEIVLGNEHPNAAYCLHNIGSAYVELGDFNRAHPLLKRALAIREKFLPPNHPLTQATRDWLEICEKGMGKR